MPDGISGEQLRERILEIPPPSAGGPRVRPFTEADLGERDQAVVHDFIYESRFRRVAELTIRTEWNSDITLHKAFYHGFQSPLVDTATGRLVNAEPIASVARLNNNVLPDYVRTMISLYVKDGARWRTAPASSEDSDRDAARRCDQFLSWIWAHQKMDTKQMDLLHYVLTESMGVLKILWDSDAQEINIDVVSPQRLYWEPGVPHLDDATWCVEASVRSTDQIREQFGIEVEGSERLSKDMAEHQTQYGFTEQTLDGRIRFQNDITADGHGGMEWVPMLEYWERPSRRYPDGRYIVSVGEERGRIIFYRAFPYAHGRLPYIAFEDRPAVGRAFPSCTMWDLAQIVREINRITELLDQHMERAIDPPVLAPQGSLNNSDIDDPKNKLIQYSPTGGFPPTYLNVPQLTGTALQELDRLYATFERIAGTPPVIHGAPATNVRTWSQQESMRETAEQKLLVAHRRHERRMEQAGKMILQLAQEFVSQPQMMKVWGDAQQFEFMEFQGIDVPGEVDVNVQMGSSLQRSKAAQRALVMQLVERQFFVLPIEIQERISRLISFDDVEGLLNPDVARQQVDMRHELMLLEQGMALNAMPTQNHLAWLQMLGEYMGRFAFRQLQLQNPPAAYNIGIRYMQHLLYVQPVLPEIGQPQTAA